MTRLQLCFKITLPIGLVLIILTIGSYLYADKTLDKLVHKVNKLKNDFKKHFQNFLIVIDHFQQKAIIA